MSKSTALRAQLSIEIVPLMALGLAMLLVFIVFISGKLTSVQDQSERVQLQSVVQQVHEEIRIASGVQDGYERNFTIRKDTAGRNYTISIINSRTIMANTSDYEASAVTFNVSGQPRPGENRIAKSNGKIYLN